MFNWWTSWLTERLVPHSATVFSIFSGAENGAAGLASIGWFWFSLKTQNLIIVRIMRFWSCLVTDEQRRRDSNPRIPWRISGFQDRCNKPLYHSSVCTFLPSFRWDRGTKLRLKSFLTKNNHRPPYCHPHTLSPRNQAQSSTSLLTKIRERLLDFLVAHRLIGRPVCI